MTKLRLSLLIGSIALIAAAFYGSAIGQTSAPAPATRVAVCDVEDIYANYTRARDLVAKLNQDRDAVRAENEERGRAIDALQMELEGLKEDSQECQDRLNEIQRLTIDRQSWLQYKEAVILREHARLTSQMYEQINQAVETAAKEGGIQIVLFKQRPNLQARDTRELLEQIRSRKVLYSDPGVDITQLVLTRLNDAYRAKGQ
jgi:Skp family chaperone for outer membrane proteins